MSTQVETLTYTGTLVELGGPELGKSGHEKPRAVKIKEDLSAQYGKTFRTWHDSLEWNDLEQIGLGSIVTVEYIVEPRLDKDGNQLYTPQGEPLKPSNKIVGVKNGAGASAPDGGSGGDWGEPEREGGEASKSREEPVASTPARPASWDEVKAKVAGTATPQTKDDYWERREAGDEERTRQMVAAWAIEQAIRLGKTSSEDIHDLAHNLILLKERIAAETA